MSLRRFAVVFVTLGSLSCAEEAIVAPASPCKTATDCAAGQICDAGACTKCGASSQCASGLVCVAGACGQCKANSDCAAGEACVSGVCGPCTADAQCGSAESCFNGTCGACGDARPCAPGLVCVAGACEACTSSEQCRSGEVCLSGACGPCASNPQCSGGKACISGACAACTSAAQCLAGQGCVSGACGPCGANADCGSGAVCLDGVCGQCAKNSDCAAGLACRNRTCGACTQNADCTAPQTCASGVCTSGGDPTMTKLVPNHGPWFGGNTVVVHGTGLDTIDAFTFGSGGDKLLTGGAAAVSADGTTLTIFAVPDIPVTIIPVPVSVSVRIAGTQRRIVLAGAYTYDAVLQPTLTSITPTRGPATGGQLATLTGTNFFDTMFFSFAPGGCGVGTYAFNTSDDKKTTQVFTPDMTLPASNWCNLDYTVSRVANVGIVSLPQGLEEVWLPNAYTFDPASASLIQTIAPNRGPVGGGNTVTLLGVRLANGQSVGFSGYLLNLSGVSADGKRASIVVPAGAGTPGSVDVTLQSEVQLAKGYTYEATPSPAIASMTPDRAPVLGGVTLAITGRLLTNGQTLSFGGATAQISGANAGGTAASVVVPASIVGAGTVDVSLDGVVVLARAFTYEAP